MLRGDLTLPVKDIVAGEPPSDESRVEGTIYKFHRNITDF